LRGGDNHGSIRAAVTALQRESDIQAGGKRVSVRRPSQPPEVTMLDIGLAYLHHLAVFGLVGLLCAELVLVRPGLDAAQARRIARLDGVYGGLAGLVIVAGLLRVFFGDKGWGFYVESHVFWTKMALFLAMGLVSIAPTMAFMKWRKAAEAEAGYAVPEAEILRARRFIHAELLIVALIPLAAAAMARGF
jgi:putative membrane protein